MEKGRNDDYFRITWPTVPRECHGICQNADNQSNLDGQLSTRRYLDQIKKDGKRGCYKCLVLYFSCREFKPTREWLNPRSGESRPRKNRLALRCCCDEPGVITLIDGDESAQQIQLYVETGTPKPAWKYIRPGGSLMRKPREEYGSVLSSWITTCNLTHKSCTTNGKLPQRVLYVGTKAQHSLFLHISRGGVGRYVALSYCWGNSHPPKTTLANLKEQRKCISFDTLPRTFQDAITVTRELGIRYIWIDSLCILQDQLSDWQTESSKMAAYYSNAYLVIAAAQSSNPDGGLFDSLGSYSPLKSHTTTEIGQIINPDATISRIYRRKLDGFYSQSRHHSFLSESPLNTRAWALQENVLARLIVHFTRGELLWECVEGLRCECMEAENNSCYTTRVPGMMRAYQFTWLRYPNDTRSIYDLWLGLLQRYSGLALSYDSDILPGLSGLAKLWQSRGAGKYLAGFWEENILESMLWNICGPRQLQRPEKYRAPSWSPFALEDADGYHDRRTSIHFSFANNYHGLVKRHAVVLDAGTTPLGIDPTGQITSAFIQIRGHVTRVKVLSNDILLEKRRVCVNLDVGVDFDKGITLTIILIGCNADDYPVALVLKPVGDNYERVGTLTGYKEIIEQLLAGTEETVKIV